MSSKSTILTEHHNIQTPCKLFVVGEPQVLLIQPSARHEEKNDGVQREVESIAQASGNGFAIVFFDCVEWARASCRGLTMLCRAMPRWAATLPTRSAS